MVPVLLIGLLVLMPQPAKQPGVAALEGSFRAPSMPRSNGYRGGSMGGGYNPVTAAADSAPSSFRSSGSGVVACWASWC